METKTSTPLKLPWFPWVGKKRPFYGWVIVAMCEVTSFIQGIANQGFATYLGPLQQEFGWSRAVLAGSRSATQIENASLGPFQGYMVDRLGPRLNIAIGSFLVGIGLILFGFTHSLFMYYFSNIIIALGNSFVGLLVMSVAINHWFRRKRTLAQSIAFLGFTMAGVAGVPALVYLQTTMGWRASAIISGFVVMAIGLPSSMFLRRSPEPYGLLPDGDKPGAGASTTAGGHQAAQEYDFTLREAIRTRTFWFLSVGQAIGSLGMGAVQVHLFLHLEHGVGLSRTTAAFVWTVASITNIPSRLIGGFFGDRLPKNLIIGGAIVAMGTSVFVLAVATSFPMALAYAVLYGIGWGVRTPVMNAIQGDYFGRRSQGLISGWLTLFSLPISIGAPVIAGYMADVQGSYRPIFIIMSFLTFAGAALVFLSTRPKPPARKDNFPTSQRMSPDTS